MGRLRALGLSAALFPGALIAQNAPAPVALSFSAASERLTRTSPALSGADHASTAAREGEAALKALHRPIVTVSAQYIEYQKTFSLDVGGVKQAGQEAVTNYLDTLPDSVAPPFQQVAAEIAARLSQALPGLYAQIPDTLSYRYRADAFRPTVQAVLPLYSGGAIPAIQRGAAANVALVDARSAQARDLAQINLIRLYFGQLTAQALVASTKESLTALDSVYSDAVKLEKAGVTPRASTLEAQVARDTAERAWQRAVLAERSASDDLARTLDADAVVATTALFVDTRSPMPASAFLGREGDLPQTRQADASRDLARASVDLARSRYRPQAFAFGEYNLNRNSALPTEPDWVVGIGARFTILSNVDRGHSLAAARAQEGAAADAAREARKQATSATFRAWNMMEAARRSFILLDSSMAAANENLRVQRISYSEGEATVTAVLGAEAALASARSQRAATAYEYVLALAGLLASSGQLDRFPDYIARANVRLPLEPAR